MMRFNNVLEGISVDSVMFYSAKDSLVKGYDKTTMTDILKYLQGKQMHDEVIRLVISLFQDKKFEDSYVSIFTDTLSSHFPYEKWSEYKSDLVSILQSSIQSFGREQLICIGDCFERVYAKGFYDVLCLLQMIYGNINLKTEKFGYLNSEYVRITAAKTAYCCNRYNYWDSISLLESLKSKIKTAKLGWLKPTINYYIGLCKCYNHACEIKGSVHYINKASLCGFDLAQIYVKYSEINSEATKKLQQL